MTIPNVFPGATLKIRTFDQRTGASSEEFVATIDANQDFTPPQLASHPGGISGFAFRDTNANGRWDLGEQPLTDWGIELRNIDDQLLNMQQSLDPDSVVVHQVGPNVTVSTDSRRIERILANLIVNGLRHGKPPVEVTVSGRTVEVVDHGNGYPEELIAEGPRRFRSGMAERGVGHGLGLTIAAGHAKVLGAELTFGAAPGGGALARLVLPATETQS